MNGERENHGHRQREEPLPLDGAYSGRRGRLSLKNPGPGDRETPPLHGKEMASRPKKHLPPTTMAVIMLFVLIMGLFTGSLFFIRPEITGLASYSPAGIQGTYNTSSQIELELPGPADSVTLSGNLTGTYGKVSLRANGTGYIIMEEGYEPPSWGGDERFRVNHTGNATIEVNVSERLPSNVTAGFTNLTSSVVRIGPNMSVVTNVSFADRGYSLVKQICVFTGNASCPSRLHNVTFREVPKYQLNELCVETCSFEPGVRQVTLVIELMDASLTIERLNVSYEVSQDPDEGENRTTETNLTRPHLNMTNVTGEPNKTEYAPPSEENVSRGTQNETSLNRTHPSQNATYTPPNGTEQNITPAMPSNISDEAPNESMTNQSQETGNASASPNNVSDEPINTTIPVNQTPSQNLTTGDNRSLPDNETNTSIPLEGNISENSTTFTYPGTNVNKSDVNATYTSYEFAGNLTINLSRVFSSSGNATYLCNQSPSVMTRVQENLLSLEQAENVTLPRNETIGCYMYEDGNITHAELSLRLLPQASSTENATPTGNASDTRVHNIIQRARQQSAEVGKPVTWKASVKEGSYRLPENIQNLSFTSNTSLPQVTIQANGVNMTLGEFRETRTQKRAGVGAMGRTASKKENVTVSISAGDNRSAKGVWASYETEPPKKREKRLGSKLRRKEIVIYSDAGVHYHNVTAYSDIPEDSLSPRLYHIKNGSRVDVTQNPRYDVTFEDTDGDGQEDRITWVVPRLSEQQFEIGVASINTHRSRYHPGENAAVTIVALDKDGYLVPNASVTVNVTDPAGSVLQYESDDKIAETSRGIYEFNFTHTDEEGEYALDVRAEGPNVSSTMSSSFTVTSYYEFGFIRDMPATTDPWQGPFNASLTISPHIDRTYNLTERIPPNFTIVEQQGGHVHEGNASTTITWYNLTGQETFSYSLQPPKKSPELYGIGEARIDYANTSFYEARPWYLAVDPELVGSPGINYSEKYFYDDFFDDSYVSSSTDITFNATESGGAKLGPACLDTPFGSGCWRYRREMTLVEEGGRSYDAYPFMVTLDTQTLIGDGKLDGNCSDLRVSWVNTTSGKEENASYWLEEGSCNRSESYLWVKAPVLSSHEEQTYYIYYGNTQAEESRYHSGKRVFPFFDDFNAGSLNTSLWNDNPGGNYSFPDGAGYVEYWNPDVSDGWGTSPSNYPSFVSEPSFQNGTIHYRMFSDKRETSESDFDGSIGVREPNTDSTPEGYFFMLDSRDINNTGIIEDAFATYHASFDAFVPQDVWIRSLVRFAGERLSFWNDFHEYTISAADSTYSDAGRISAWCDSDDDGQTRAALDWLFYYERTSDSHTTTLHDEYKHYSSQGNLSSIRIDPPGISTWERLSLTHNFSDSTNITYSILNESRGKVCDFEVAESITEYDLSGCTNGYDSMYAQATLSTENRTRTPRLDEWKITWLNDTLATLHHPADMYQQRMESFYMNGTVIADKDNCSIDAIGQYRLIGEDASIVDDEYSDFSTYSESENVSVSHQLMLNTTSLSGTWYDQDWSHKAVYSLDFGTTISARTLNLTVYPSQINFSLTNNFSNVIVTFRNRSKGIEQKIPHWVQYHNSSEALLWTRLPELNQTNITVFVYYDNSDATNTSNGEDVFRFFDDFSEGSLDTSRWVENEGVYEVTNNEFFGENDSHTEYVYSDEYELSGNRTVRFRMRTSTNTPVDWDSGIGIGAWNFLDGHSGMDSGGWGDSTESETEDAWLLIDGSRWFADIKAEGSESRVEASTYHNYEITVRENWASFEDLTQGRFINASGSAYGDIFIVNDAEDEELSDTIIDWIYVYEKEDSPQVTFEREEEGEFLSGGHYVSESFDAGAPSVQYTLFDADYSVPSGSNVSFFTRTSDEGSYWTEWSQQEVGEGITSDGRRYIQYKIIFDSPSAGSTGEVKSVLIEYMTSTPRFVNYSNDDTILSGNNPYSCGTMDDGDVCHPEFPSMTPKRRGKYYVRLNTEGEGCDYNQTSNVKVLYSFAQTQIQDIAADKETVALNDSVTFTGVLLDGLSEPVAEEEIHFHDEGEYIGSATTDAEGTFSFSYRVPVSRTLGNHTITAAFEKDYRDFYLSSSAQVDIHVSSRPSITDLEVKPSVAGNAEEVDIRSWITDPRGIDAAWVNVTSPNGTVFTRMMNNGSPHNYSVTFSEGWRTGRYAVDVIANNSDGILASENTGFMVQIDGHGNALTSQDAYRNYEEVPLSTSFRNKKVANWSYRKSVTLDPSQKRENVTFVFTPNAANFKGWAHTEGDDLRFTRGAEDEQLLPHWVKYWNSSAQNASVHVRIPLLESSTTVNLYYGNQEVSDYGDKRRSQLWYDNVDEDRNSSYAEGELYNRGANNGYFKWNTTHNRIDIDNSNDDMYAFPYDVNGTPFYAEITTQATDNDALGLILDTDGAYYEAIISEDYPNGGDDGLFTQNDGEYPSMIAPTNSDYNPMNGRHVVGLSYDGEELRMYVDGKLEVIKSASIHVRRIGFVSLSMDQEEYLYNFTVRRTAPSVTLMSEDSETPNGFFNAGETPVRGYRWGIVQRWDGEVWEDIYPAVINDLAFENLHTMDPAATIGVASDWNADPWKTGVYPRGKYRVKLALVRNTSEPQGPEAVIEDSYGERLESYYPFRIKEASLVMTNLSHDHLLESGVYEYETSDTIDWINVSIGAVNNTAFNSEVWLTLLDEEGFNYVGFGPDEENKEYGEIEFNTTKSRTWDNSSEGYPIPRDISGGQYLLQWDVYMSLSNGPATTNVSEYLVIHNLPNNFTTSSLDRLYINQSISHNFTLYNPWSKNISDVNVSINCPDVSGVECRCRGTDRAYCSMSQITSEEDAVFPFNITAGPGAEMADYWINFTINYTNPPGDFKSWAGYEKGLLEVREEDLFGITIHNISKDVTRGSDVYVKAYAKNSNASLQTYNASLNYTAYPARWENKSKLEKERDMLAAGEKIWNNVTFSTSTNSSLGEQDLRMESAAFNLTPDFKSVFVDVFARTNVSPFYPDDRNASIGETVSLQAQLRLDNGTGLAGEKIYFYNQNTSTLVGTDYTNASGMAKTSYYLDTMDTGLYTLEAWYKGDSDGYTRPTNTTTVLDVGLKPSIDSVNASPGLVANGYNVTLTANVTDDDGIDVVEAIVTDPAGTEETLRLWHNGGDRYAADYNHTWLSGVYRFRVRANDSTGSTNTSGNYSFSVRNQALIHVDTAEEFNQHENVTLTPGVSSHRWYNASWVKREMVSVNTSANISNHTIQLHLNGSNFDFSSSAGDDIFITQVNATDFTRAPHHVTHWDTQTKEATLLVKVPHLTNETLLHIYYNGTAGGEGSRSQALSFYDDFESDSSGAYTEVNLSNATGMFYWDAVDGRLEGDDSGGHFTAYPSDVFLSQPYISAHGYTQDDGFVGVSITNGSHYYHGYVSSQEQDGIYVQTNGSSPALLAAGGDFESAIMQEVGLAYNGTHLIMIVNETVTATHQIDIDPVHAGVSSGLNSPGVRYQNLSIRSYTDRMITSDIHDERGSFVTDRSGSPLKGYLRVRIQEFSDGYWTDTATMIHDYANGTARRVPSDDILDVASVYNENPWDTGKRSGTYRLSAAMLNDKGDVMNTSHGPLMSTQEFIVNPPKVNVTIKNIRVYAVNSSTRYAGGDLTDSGLSQSFKLFTNRSYRIEIEAYNGKTSSEWNLSESAVRYTGLNASWRLNGSDVWYRVGTEEPIGEGEQQEDTIIWNTSTYETGVSNDTTLTFYYALNITPPSSTGDYPVTFIINDSEFVESDHSTYHVVREPKRPPRLFENIYNLTRRDVIRSEQNTTIYARWDQEIEEAEVHYNATTVSPIADDIVLPENNPHNYTNHTLSPASNWPLGRHTAKVLAKNTAGIWNDTLPRLSYWVYGLSRVDNMQVNDTSPGTGDTVNINCSVVDTTNSSPIEGYNVTLYSSSDGFLAASTTDAGGDVMFSYTPLEYGDQVLTCNISPQKNYRTGAQDELNTTLFVREYTPPRYHDVYGPVRVYKTERISTTSNWTDNAELERAYLETNLSGLRENVTNSSLAGTQDIAGLNYTIPATIMPGSYTWRHYARDTSRNYNRTPLQWIDVWGWSALSAMRQEPANVMVGNDTTTSCRVVDSNSTDGIGSYNVSFYRDDVLMGMNRTNLTGWAQFTFNDSSLGLHTISCRINDSPVKMYNVTSEDSRNETLNVVNVSDIYPPSLITYGINDTELERGECVSVYGQWDEKPNVSKVIYNVTDVEHRDRIARPYTNNWTNTTVCTNITWGIGTHGVRLWANDSVGNINDSVRYLDFNLTGQSSVRWKSPEGSITRGEQTLTCGVKDNETGEGIEGYTVQFYGPDGYIGVNTTNASGEAVYNTVVDKSPGTHEYQCQIKSTSFYEAQPDISSEELDVTGSLSITPHSPKEGEWVESRNVEFNWTATTGVEGESMYCNLSLDGNVNKSNVEVKSQQPEVTSISNVNESWHNWSVSCWTAGLYNHTGKIRFLVDTGENEPPSVPQQRTPTDGNDTLFSRNPLFTWNESTDPDNDNLTYELYITLEECGYPLGCSVYEINKTGIEGENTSPLQDLDVDSVYSWKLRAYDGVEYSNWTEWWNFTIESRVVMSLSNDNVSFGAHEPGSEIVSRDDGEQPLPFSVRNDGNVKLDINNISVQEELWETPSAQLPSRFFKIRVSNSSEEGSYDYNASRTSWINASRSNTDMIKRLEYDDAHDEVYLHVGLKVPWDEPPGNKMTTMVFFGEVMQE